MGARNQTDNPLALRDHRRFGEGFSTLHPFFKEEFSSLVVTKPSYILSGTVNGARYSRVNKRSASLSFTNFSLALSKTRVRPVR